MKNVSIALRLRKVFQCFGMWVNLREAVEVAVAVAVVEERLAVMIVEVKKILVVKME